MDRCELTGEPGAQAFASPTCTCWRESSWAHDPEPEVYPTSSQHQGFPRAATADTVMEHDYEQHSVAVCGEQEMLGAGTCK